MWASSENRGGWTSTDSAMNCIECGYLLSGIESVHLHYTDECYGEYCRRNNG
jgi:hypothetical protein